MKRTLGPAFWARVDRGDSCWRWKGYHDPDGYAVASLKGAPRAHRVTYENKYGEIPDGLVLDHFACDNRWCINPDHLRPVSVRENTLRSSRAPLVTPAMRCRKGHDLTAGNLGTRPDGYPKCLACMREYQAAYLARKAQRHAS